MTAPIKVQNDYFSDPETRQMVDWQIDRLQQYIFVRRSPYGGPGWEVAWEEGPYEWPLSISARRNIWTHEYETPTFLGTDTENYFLEPMTHYSMGVYPA